MITRLSGSLTAVGDDRAVVSVGPVRVEVLVPAADVEGLAARVGEEVDLHTMLYLEGDASGGNLTPRLIGFARELDRGFFGQFITVKGIGPKKALRALAVPAGEVAAAIETKNTVALTKLPQIGKRAAEQIVATLAGKVGAFAGDAILEDAPAAAPVSDVEADAVATLVALGEKKADAEAMLERVRKTEPAAIDAGADAIVQAMLRLRSSRR